MPKFKIELLRVTRVEALEMSRKDPPVPVPVAQTWPKVEAETSYGAKKSCFLEFKEGILGQAFRAKVGREIIISDVLPFMRGQSHVDNRAAEVSRSDANEAFGKVLDEEVQK